MVEDKNRSALQQGKPGHKHFTAAHKHGAQPLRGIATASDQPWFSAGCWVCTSVAVICGAGVVVGAVSCGAAASFLSPSSPDSLRNSRTPLPTAPKTSGSLPTPNNMATINRINPSSTGPRLKGIDGSSFEQSGCRCCTAILDAIIARRRFDANEPARTVCAFPAMPPCVLESVHLCLSNCAFATLP